MIPAIDGPATRARGLERLRAFASRAGRDYEHWRNYDLGPGRHEHVSQLSPFLRRRLLTEPEVIQTALEHHGPAAADTFVQELCWRSYSKGWLEHRPGIWRDYVHGLQQDLAQAASDAELGERLRTAETGRTGLDAFDTWARELVDTGYLHNHARMWFASIWIFTLELPWRLGADFFYRHLLDGDPASNTLGWRWVAGLHTRGKAYEARPDNIAQFTRARFRPDPDSLARDIQPLDHLEPGGLPAPMDVREPEPPRAGLPTALLITEEDSQPGDFPLDELDVRALAALPVSRLRSPRPVPDAIAELEHQALADTARRLDITPTWLPTDNVNNLVDWARACGVQQIVTPFIPRGPLQDWLDKARPALDAHHIRLCEWRRDWDERVWPHTRAGFFRLKKQLPRILDEAGLTA